MAPGDTVDEDDATRALCARLGLDAPASPRLVEALTHPSYANEQPGAPQLDNQRLEFLGDAVLGLCVSELLMEELAAVDEGQLTVMRAALVNAGSLADAARRSGVGAALRMGRGADGAGERDRTNVLADALEALIGAVYLDLGLDQARRVSRVVLGDAFADVVAGGIERDAKSRLQELVQARGLATPTYQVVAVEGPPHARLFTARVTIVFDPEPGSGAEVVGEGRGSSKKLAEQAAARAVLTELSAVSGQPSADDGSLGGG
jgi:ribonuclease III